MMHENIRDGEGKGKGRGTMASVARGRRGAFLGGLDSIYVILTPTHYFFLFLTPSEIFDPSSASRPSENFRRHFTLT